MTTKEPLRKHVVEMDVARALATIAVVTIHISATPLALNPRGGRAAILYILMNAWARFALPAFVALSGAGLSLSNRHKEGYFQFLTSRLTKIIPAYLAWTLVYTLITDPTAHTLAIRPFSGVQFLQNVFTGHAYHHLYFVPLITVLYLLFPLLHNIMKSIPGLVICALITMTDAIIICYGGYPDQFAFLARSVNPMHWLFYLALGVWLAKPEVVSALKSPRLRLPNSLALVTCLAIMTVLMRYHALRTAGIDASLNVVGILMIPYTLLFFTWVYNKDWSPTAVSNLTWISRHSYAIYLVHPLVLIAFFSLAYKTAAQRAQFPSGIAALAAALGISALLAATGARTKRLLLHQKETP